MPKSKQTAADCIAAIKATAKEGEISDATAKAILADIKARAERRAQKTNQKLEDALKDIAGEWAINQQTSKALQRRNELLGIKRQREFVDYSMSKGVYGKGVERYLENIWASWKGMEGKYLDRLYSELKSQGVWEDFSKGLHSQDWWREMWELSLGDAGKPGSTGNEKAAKMAAVYFPIKREMNGLKIRHGAFMREAPGHVLVQTHDPNLLRRLGGTGWGKEDMNVAFQKWKSFVTAGDVKIDWERTLDGPEDRDKFLYSFFKNIYTRVFDGTNEVDVDQFRQQGSLASRISSGRVLWFADADSAWKYNEAFGIKSFNQAVISDIHQSTRNAALMMYLGPNPRSTLDSGRSVMLNAAKELPDSKKQVDALNRSKIDREFEKLTGLADMAERPTVARWIDNIKAYTLLTKGTSIFLSSWSDKAFGQSVMAYHGISALHRFVAQLQTLTPATEEGRKALGGISFWANTMIGANAARWTEDVRPTTILQRGVHWMFDVTGFNWHMKKHRYAYAMAMANQMADEAHLKFDELPAERQRYFGQYDITPTEWDAWRRRAASVDDIDGVKHKVLTPDLAGEMTDSELNVIVRSQGLSETSANRGRVRDEMEAKLRAYFADFVHEAVPEPGLAEASLRGATGKRGTLMREVTELAMVFKGFPLTVGMKMLNREMLRAEGMSARQWWAFADKGKWQVSLLLAETAALGYLSMTARDLLNGKTPKRLLDDEGKPNYSVFVASLQRGGGLGIYGDMLFSDYDAHTRDFITSMSGPVFSQLNPLAELLTAGRRLATEPGGPNTPSGESTLYKLERFAQDNTPLINMFYVKPILDMFIFYNLKEALSPGVLRRMERSTEKLGYQGYYISPTEVQSLAPEDRLPYAAKKITGQR